MRRSAVNREGVTGVTFVTADYEHLDAAGAFDA